MADTTDNTTPQLNREARRMAKKQGLIDADGQPVRQRRAPQPSSRDQRSSPRDFFDEVRSELKKVVWPTRDEVIKYSVVVLIFVVVLTTVVALLDYGFGEAMLWLFRR